MLLAATAVAVASSTGCGSGAGHQASTTKLAAPQAQWVRLPRLTASVPFDPAAAKMLTVKGELIVTVTNRGSTGSTNTVFSFRKTADGWSEFAHPLRVDSNSRVDVAGGQQLCVTAGRRGPVVVRCLSNGRWHQIGGPALASLDAKKIYAGAIVSPAGFTVLSSQGAPKNGYYHYTTVARTYDRHRGWHRVGRNTIGAAFARGAEHPVALSRGHTLCIAFEGLPADPTYGPSIQTQCLRGGLWKAAAPPTKPTVAVANVAAEPSDSPPVEPEPLLLSGAVATPRGLNVGINTTTRSGSPWTLSRIASGGIQPITMPKIAPTWNSQGSLYDVRGELWAIRLDQDTNSPSMAMLRTRLTVLRETPGSKMTEVGHPIRTADRFHGPLFYDLASSQGSIFAMASVPTPNGLRDEIRIFQLADR